MGIFIFDGNWAFAFFADNRPFFIFTDRDVACIVCTVMWEWAINNGHFPFFANNQAFL